MGLSTKRLDIRKNILEKVQDIAAKHLKDTNVELYLFGSWARHEERQSSDIDLAIYYKEPLPQGILTKLRLALEDSTIPYRVELVDLTKTDRDFINKVREEGVLWSVYNNA